VQSSPRPQPAAPPTRRSITGPPTADTPPAARPRTVPRARTHADGVVRAVLETLTECLPDGFGDLLAAELAPGVPRPPRVPARSAGRAPYRPGEFAARVAVRAGVPQRCAVELARAVLATATRDIDRAFLDRLGRCLPGDVRRLLPPRRTGPAL
jgi:uncharacterized protein (DUF2267 family)